MDEGAGSMFFNLLRSPLGIISGGRGFRGLFSKNEPIEETEEAMKEELMTMLNIEQQKGSVNLFEKEMMKRVLKLYDTKAKEVMVPRTSVFAVNIEDDTSDIIDAIIEERYSRVPIYEKEIDNIVGVVHIKDIFAQMRKGNLDSINIKGIMKTPYFVHEYKSIDEIFLEMQKLRTHMALVIDEYGGFSGIITIEDLVEEIVGDISDEDDDDDALQPLVKISDNTYKVDGLTSISDINELLDTDLPTDINETIGGLLVGTLGGIPNLEDEEEHGKAVFGQVELKAIKVSDKRIETLLLRLSPRKLLDIS